MTLAQVVYNMSKDREFASQLQSNPESTLATRGYNLSKEELAFLLSPNSQEKSQILTLAKDKNAAWR
jgi:hypothetical protein